MLRQYGPGKYSLVIDGVVDGLSTQGYCVENVGDSETFGYYGLVSWDFASIESEHNVTRLYGLNAEESEFLASHPWAIVIEDSQGFVKVEYYPSESSARVAWGHVEADYSNFIESCEA